MKTEKWMFTVLSVLAVISSGGARAMEIAGSQSVTETPESNRTSQRFGAYLSVLGDPAPNLIGINGAYNVTDYMRVNVGFGHTSVSAGTDTASLTTFGAGAKFMMPDWNLTPVLGANLSYAIFSGSGDMSVGGLTATGLVPYLSVGADWQAKSGFNAGLGMNVAIGNGSSAPYFNVGYFF